MAEYERKWPNLGEIGVLHHFGRIGLFVVGQTEVMYIVVAVPAGVRFYLS